MKWLRIVFVATSIILSLVIVCAIINCEISYKYEIENRCGDKIDILWVEEWLKETIKVWQFFLCYVHWDGTPETEDRIKEETKATIRCLPFDADEESLTPGKCMVTGKPSARRVLFARAY